VENKLNIDAPPTASKPGVKASIYPACYATMLSSCKVTNREKTENRIFVIV